jgi:PAS domain S-box-containing protein
LCNAFSLAALSSGADSSAFRQIDTKGIIQKYNESAAQTFGYSKEEAIGQNIKMLMPPDVADKHDGYLRRYVETGVKHIIGSNRGALLKGSVGHHHMALTIWYPLTS